MGAGGSEDRGGEEGREEEEGNLRIVTEISSSIHSVAGDRFPVAIYSISTRSISSSPYSHKYTRETHSERIRAATNPAFVIVPAVNFLAMSEDSSTAAMQAEACCARRTSGRARKTENAEGESLSRRRGISDSRVARIRNTARMRTGRRTGSRGSR